MTTIEWTDQTWNPVTGCDRVSPGCDNCYALAMSARLKAMGQAKYQTDGDPRTSGPGFGVQCHPETLEEPLRWRKPRRVFVNSMSDLFHPKVPDDFIADVFAVMALAEQHTFQVLTKRPKRMRALVGRDGFIDTVALNTRSFTDQPFDLPAWPLPNVWLGTSVEDQQRANQRIPYLLDTPAAVRFLSCEPLLGPVGLHRHLRRGRTVPMSMIEPQVVVRRLDWCIVGGESGPGARPMDLDWARDIVKQCQAVGVPVFVKQLGSRWGKNHHDIDAFPPDLRVREWPDA